MRRKKGYALLLVIVVTLFLMVLSTIVLSLATSGYISTKKIEQNNNLKLAAESGIDKGNLFLRNYILNHSDVLIHPTQFIPGSLNPEPLNLNSLKANEVTYTIGSITVKIVFSPYDVATTFHDVTTDRNVAYIQITSSATDLKVNSKTVTAVLDKNGINNIYFDRIFNGSLTTVGDLSSDVGLDLNNTNLTLSGKAFFQGKTVNLNPSTFIMSSGEIKVKAQTFNYKASIGSMSEINLYKNDNLVSTDSWKDVIIPSIKMLNVYNPLSLNLPASLHPDEVQNFDSSDMDNVDEFIKFKPDQVVPNQLIPTLVTYKGKKSSEAINFQELVDGKNLLADSSGIFNSIINQLKKDNKSLNSLELYNIYGKFYKMIIIEGDLTIPNDATENFNNYLIYCTGKVTFEGEAHFYNSSIFSRSIIFKGDSKKVEFYGVATDEALQHIIGTTKLNDFSSTDKGIINNYLINNLENYGDYIQYKTLKWKE